MKNIYKSIFVLVLGLSFVEAKHGLSQRHLIDVSPTPKSHEVKANSQFSFTFDNKIIEKSIKPHSITIKKKKKKSKNRRILGKIQINENILTFIPSNLLEKGIYKIKVKPIRLERKVEDNSKKRRHHIHTKAIHFKFEVSDDAKATVVELIATPKSIALSEHKSTQLSITAKYTDNSSVNITQVASYSSSDNSVDVEKGLITSSNAGTATISISYEDKTTTVQVEVYETIEGHRLPPEPKNPDATLLGVDTNDNGVRDEVERWIYKEMPTYNYAEIERVIAMQQAKAYQMALIDPTNKDDKVLNATERGTNCWWYYHDIKNIDDSSVSFFRIKLTDTSFNTKERLKTYLDYDYSLKGRIFTSSIETIDDCDVNINEIL